MTDDTTLSPWISEQIRSGRAILFLGAGAARGCRSRDGRQCLDGNQLRDLLAETFLGGELKNKPLAQVAEYSKAESSLVAVQETIYRAFEPLMPADFHLLIPTFRWRAIVTTNYDLIIERAYADATKPLQQLGPIIKDGDQLPSILANPYSVPYLKLHGCISAIRDPEIPLILASEEYAKHRRHRENLFRSFQDWAREGPVIFCGYDIADPNIQQILFDLSDQGINRPAYAIVNPALSQYDMRYWQGRRFQPLKKTFQSFLIEIDSKIQAHARQLAVLLDHNASSIQRHVIRGIPSDALLVYLEDMLEHVRTDMPYVASTPADFYRGQSSSWYPIIEGLDVRRRVTDDIEIESLLEHPKGNAVQIFLVKGHAGSGKTVTLRRFAWEAVTQHEALVFWLKEGALLKSEFVREIYNLTDRRFIIVVDDAIPRLEELVRLVSTARRESIPLTLVFGARTNEWNVAGGELAEDLERTYEIRDLSSAEIDKLLTSLEEHGCLGELKRISADDRRKFFELTAERQLLVALHEATSGKSFEEIVLDEYNNVVPLEAQILYLDVCTLHRFRVGLRAGLLSRISGVTFTYFGDRLLKPLEHIVSANWDPYSRDYAYKTRHQVIADIVFRLVLKNQEKRVEQIVRIIGSMNVDYESDKIAFTQLIRGRDLADLFDDRVLVDRIFEAALRAHAHEAHVEHQRAIFELNHPNGSTQRAMKAIDKAENSCAVGSAAVLHTKALVLRRLALESPVSLQREKLRKDAKQILQRQIRKPHTSHAFRTLGEILLDELSDYVTKVSDPDDTSHDRVISSLIADAEEVVANGLQRFPGESYLLELDAKVANVVGDAPRAKLALDAAFRTNPGNGFIATRLAGIRWRQGDKEGAMTILLQSMEENPLNKVARLQLARYLIETDESTNSTSIIQHLRSCFTDGDTNYEAQFLFARQHFLYGDREVGIACFKQLRKAKVPWEMRDQARKSIKDISGKAVIYDGVLLSKHDTYCFVRISALSADAFVHHTQFRNDTWTKVYVRTKVTLSVAFNFQGLVGKDLTVAGDHHSAG